MSSEIFLPVFYMVCLTFVVLLLSVTLRLKEIYLNGTVAGEEQRHPPFNEGSTLLKNTQRNLSNLLEFPVLFYVVCICIYIVGKVDDNFMTLAYWFFYLRVIHSVYHIFFNQLVYKGGFPLRALIWIPGAAIMMWMWMRLVSLI